MIKIVFLGTPKYAVTVLEALYKKFRNKKGESPIVAVVTREPRPKGRKKLLAYSPVDTWAYKHKIQIFHSVEGLLKSGIKADLGVLVAYGEIIPKAALHCFPHGILNIHPSLLPKYRGASPIQAAIASGEKVTGGTIINIDEKVDHGPIVSQFEEEIVDSDNQISLGNRIFVKSSLVLSELLDPYLAGKIKLKTQDDKLATFTTLVRKEYGFIPSEFFKSALTGSNPVKKNWDIPFIKDSALTPNAENLNNFIRAMNPWPCVWTLLRLNSSEQAKRLKIIKSHLEKGKLVPDEVQIEGKNLVTWEEFIQGYPTLTF